MPLLQLSFIRATWPAILCTNTCKKRRQKPTKRKEEFLACWQSARQDEIPRQNGQLATMRRLGDMCPRISSSRQTADGNTPMLDEAHPRGPLGRSKCHRPPRACTRFKAPWMAAVSTLPSCLWRVVDLSRPFFLLFLDSQLKLYPRQ